MGKSLLRSSDETCSAFLYSTFIVMFFVETFIMAGISTTGMGGQHGTRLAVLQWGEGGKNNVLLNWKITEFRFPS